MSYNHIIHSCVLDSFNIFLGILSKPSLSHYRSFSMDVFATMLKDKKQRKSSHFVESRQSSENWTNFLWNNNLFCFIELIYPLVTWVKTIHCRNPPNHLIYILYHVHLFLKVMIVIAYFVMLVLILISTWISHQMFLILWIIIIKIIIYHHMTLLKPHMEIK